MFPGDHQEALAEVPDGGPMDGRKLGKFGTGSNTDVQSLSPERLLH